MVGGLIMVDRAGITLADDINRLWQAKGQTPFPTADCWTFRELLGDKYNSFVMALDSYFCDIAGLCMMGRELLDLPSEKVVEAREILGNRFFENHPEFTSVTPLITELNTPNLYSKMELYETFRTRLLDLFKLIDSI
jgi:hypothetical protein